MSENINHEIYTELANRIYDLPLDVRLPETVIRRFVR